MDQLLQHLVNARILGGTYALLGIGLTLIFGIMRVVNFTHGELYAFGAYMMYMRVMLAGAEFLPRARAGDRCSASRWARCIEFVLLRRLRGRRHRHHHAGDDRRLDRAAERRAAGLGAASPSRSTRPSRPRRWCSARCRCSLDRLFVFAVALALLARHLRRSSTAPGSARRCAPRSRTARPRR